MRRQQLRLAVQKAQQPSATAPANTKAMAHFLHAKATSVVCTDLTSQMEESIGSRDASSSVSGCSINSMSARTLPPRSANHLPEFVCWSCAPSTTLSSAPVRMTSSVRPRTAAASGSTHSSSRDCRVKPVVDVDCLGTLPTCRKVPNGRVCVKDDVQLSAIRSRCHAFLRRGECHTIIALVAAASAASISSLVTD
eukprot:2482092-Amphidinium_carterae.1